MKTTTLRCKEVRPGTENHEGCILVAFENVCPIEREVDLSDASVLTKARDSLRAQGIVLRGSSQVAHDTRPKDKSSPVQIIAHDDTGDEQRLMVDRLDEYRLSSGSSLYYLHTSESADNCRWLVDRDLSVIGVEMETLTLDANNR